jgi:hypothetical protein
LKCAFCAFTYPDTATTRLVRICRLWTTAQIRSALALPSGDSSSTHDLAWAGQADCAEQVADELAQRYPTDTQMMERDLPAIRTAIAISRGEGATAEILLRPAQRHAKTSRLPSCVLSLAYLQTREFQGLIDRPSHGRTFSPSGKTRIRTFRP